MTTFIDASAQLRAELRELRHRVAEALFRPFVAAVERLLRSK